MWHLGSCAERGALALARAGARHARRQRLGQVAHRRQHGLLQGDVKCFREPEPQGCSAIVVLLQCTTMPVRNVI